MINKFKKYFFLLKNNLLNENLITTSLTDLEKRKLNELARFKTNGVLVEIGSAFGASSVFLANALSENGKLFCVDSWNVEYRHVQGELINLMYNQDGNVYKYDYDEINHKMIFKFYEKTNNDCPTYDSFLLNTKKYKNKIIPLRGESVDVSLKFDKKIDLLFVDAWHLYEGVSLDCLNWIPKVNSGGFMIFHDYGWAEGVQRSVEEFVKPVSSSFYVFENMFISIKK